jgi:hypothetical protein
MRTTTMMAALALMLTAAAPALAAAGAIAYDESNGKYVRI